MTYSGFELTIPVLPIETFTPEFQTTIIEAQEGYEKRIARRSEYRAKFSFESFILTEEQLTDLEEFFDSVSGTLDTFKYKSSIEYKATKDFEEYYLGSDYYVHSRGRAYLRPDGTTYQLVKSYGVGGDNGDTSGYKTLKHIDLSTLEIYVDDTQVFDFTVDGDTGVITFGTQPSSDAIVSFSCEYYHEVRFENKELEATLIAPGEYRISNLKLIEEVTTSYSPLDANDWSEVDYGFQFAFEPKQQESIDYDLAIRELKNEREIRRLRNESINTRFSLESNTITENEKGLLLCWFVVAKGRAITFSYRAQDLRFNTDSLSLSTVRIENESELYFKYADLELKSVVVAEEVTFEPPTDGLIVWYDAQNTGSITLDGSSNISQINDLSGNNNHATVDDVAAQATQPSLSDGWFSFDRNNKESLKIDGLRFTGSASRSMVLSLRPENLSSNNVLSIGFGPTSVNPQGQAFSIRVGNDQIAVIGYGSIYNTVVSRPIDSGEFMAITVTYDSLTLEIYEGGTLLFSGGVPQFNTNPNYPSYLGRIYDITVQNFPSSTYSGLIGEVLVYDKPLDASERQLCLDYIYSKRGTPT
ncbi:DUF2460 domain-containing protein [Myxosarcina sp. GI1(2024)]